jgi:ribosomal protein S12 methylthiotransferase accessory factor
MTNHGDFAGVLSSRFGIVRSLMETEHRAENASIHVINACSGAIARLVTGGSPVVGSGANIDHDAALRSAIGEVLERYSAKWVPTDGRAIAAYEDLKGPASHPAGFALFHDTQYHEPDFAFVPFTEATSLAWVRGTELTTGEPAWVPSQLVYLHHDLGPAESRVSYSTSSGLSCAVTYEDAVLRALLEVVERDAAMLTWYTHYTPARIDVASDRELSAIEQTRFAVGGVHHVVLDLSVFHGIPAVLALVIDDDPISGVAAFGAACSVDPRVAWLKAITEAYHTRLWALELKRTRKRLVRRPEDVRGLEDHVSFYTFPEHGPYLDFLRNPTSTISIDRLPSLRVRSAPDAIACIARMLQSAAVSTYAVDVTSPDVREAGFRVARVVCPELCRLDVSYRTRYLGGDRLYTVSRDLGLASTRLRLDDLNPYPHPFP